MSRIQPEINDSFVREMRIGLSFVAVLGIVFLYIAFGRLSGWYRPAPLVFENQSVIPVDVPVDATPDDSTPLRNVPPATQSLPGIPPQSLAQNSHHPPADQSVQQPAIPAIRVPTRQTPDSTSRQASTEFNAAPALSEVNIDQAMSQRASPFAQRNSVPPNTLRSPDVPLRVIEPVVQGDRNASDQLTAQPPMPDIHLPRVERLGSHLHQPDTAIQQTVAVQPALQPEIRRADTRPAEVVVEAGESFWTVAQRVYGDGRYFHALYQANNERVASFNELTEGAMLITPSIDKLIEQWPELCPESAEVSAPPTYEGSEVADVYTTRGDETLFDIAREELDQASRYLDIFELNRDLLPNDAAPDAVLPAGLRLRLPAND
ncbi:MAG: LysM peptidoglycan-binding domain-containing protein [Pirellulaceae bacterium]